ncbi:MAG: hypothetical protein KJ990_12660 [Proteobacteria bacterium]|nr:hypothetical protein [Pseudomonadota bacterium]MBU1648211.1 hypothetical protein [Pseudomonadota bacterium]
MAGKKGQIVTRRRADTARKRLWQSMRILRQFTLPDLMRTATAKLDNTRKMVVQLTIHGYLREVPGYVSGRKGALKSWSIAINPGPDYPMVCGQCGCPVTAKECKKAEVNHDQ